MDKTSLLERPQSAKEFYDDVLKAIEATPLNKCIVDHACKEISENDHFKAVMACKADSQKDQTKEAYDDAVKLLQSQGILRRGMSPQAKGWGYIVSPFTKDVIERIKKDDPSRLAHF